MKVLPKPYIKPVVALARSSLQPPAGFSADRGEYGTGGRNGKGSGFTERVSKPVAAASKGLVLLCILKSVIFLTKQEGPNANSAEICGFIAHTNTIKKFILRSFAIRSNPPSSKLPALKRRHRSAGKEV